MPKVPRQCIPTLICYLQEYKIIRIITNNYNINKVLLMFILVYCLLIITLLLISLSHKNLMKDNFVK